MFKCVRVCVCVWVCLSVCLCVYVLLYTRLESLFSCALPSTPLPRPAPSPCPSFSSVSSWSSRPSADLMHRCVDTHAAARGAHTQAPKHKRTRTRRRTRTCAAKRPSYFPSLLRGRHPALSFLLVTLALPRLPPPAASARRCTGASIHARLCVLHRTPTSPSSARHWRVTKARA